MNNQEPQHSSLVSISLVIKELEDRGLVLSSPWLCPVQAARYLNLSESYLASLRGKGGGPVFHRIGGLHTTKQGKAHNKVLYHRGDLDAWVRENHEN